MKTNTAFISIMAAVLITMIAISIERPGNGKISVTAHPSLYEGFLAVTNIVFAYGKPHTLDGVPYSIKLICPSRPCRFFWFHLRNGDANPVSLDFVHASGH